MCSRLSLSILSVLAVATFAVIALPVGAQEGDVPKQDGKDAKDGHDAKPDESSEARTTPVGWPPHLRDRIVKAHDDAIAKAAEALDAIEKAKSDDATKAKTDLAMMMSRRCGTGLEQRAKDLLAEVQQRSDAGPVGDSAPSRSCGPDWVGCRASSSPGRSVAACGTADAGFTAPTSEAPWPSG